MKSKAHVHFKRETKEAKKDVVFSNSWRTQYCLCNTSALQRFLSIERLRKWRHWHGVEAAAEGWLSYKHLSAEYVKKRGMWLCCFEGIYSFSLF